MGSYAQALEHKQALSDEEHEQKVTDLVKQMEANRDKLHTLKDAKGIPTPEYYDTVAALTQNYHDLRELYHPDKYPGAIARVGHLLTDALHITNPQERIQKEGAKRAAGAAADEHSALSWAGAAPISPGQATIANAKTESAAQLQMIQGKMANLKKLFPDASPEQVKEWQTELAASITGVKDPTEKYFKDLVTTTDEQGKQHYWRVPLADEPPEEVDFNGEKMQPKNPPHPSHSKFSETEAAYRHDYGIPDDQPLSMADIMFINQQTALSSGTPSSTTTNTLKQDINGWWVPITETNRRVPGFGVILSPPRGPLPHEDATARSGQGEATPPNSSGQPTTLSGVKKKAEAIAPKSGASSGGTHVGKPLFPGRTPEYTKAMNDYETAVKADSMAKEALTSHEAVQQRNLAINLIRTMAGRVNMQEYQQYTTKMGVENTIEGLILGIQNGQMPPGIVKQLADTAAANLKASKVALDTLKNMQGQQGSGDQTNPDIDAIINSLNKAHTPAPANH
jgi:hypothetical protein